jgi:hypothetical protein
LPKVGRRGYQQGSQKTFSNLANHWEQLAVELTAAQAFLEAMAELDDKKPSSPQGSN